MTELPEIKEGIYFLCKAKEVVYVGQAWNVYKRVNEHGPLKDFDSVFAIPVPTELLDEVERYWIDRIKPKLNSEYRPPIHRKKRLVEITESEPELAEPLEWGDVEQIAEIFCLSKGVLYKLADTNQITSRYLKKKHAARRRLFNVQSIRELLEASTNG
jgi:hypothetical protein